jgi:hypothetical protein
VAGAVALRLSGIFHDQKPTAMLNHNIPLLELRDSLDNCFLHSKLLRIQNAFAANSPHGLAITTSPINAPNLCNPQLGRTRTTAIVPSCKVVHGDTFGALNLGSHNPNDIVWKMHFDSLRTVN